jgi:hypothetical protein
MHSNLNCDFIISSRYACIRFKWSDFSLPSNREHIAERVNKARALFTKIIIMIQDDREQNLTKYVFLYTTQTNLLKKKLFFFILFKIKIKIL